MSACAGAMMYEIVRHVENAFAVKIKWLKYEIEVKDSATK